MYTECASLWRLTDMRLEEPVKRFEVRLWVTAHSTLGLCVFLNIFAIFTCKLTKYIY